LVRGEVARSCWFNRRISIGLQVDRGYFSSEEILACDEAGITVTLPKPMTSNLKHFGKQDFCYVAEQDVTFVLPERSSPTHSQPKNTDWCCAAI
jgi:hypothetical protein